MKEHYIIAVRALWSSNQMLVETEWARFSIILKQVIINFKIE